MTSLHRRTSCIAASDRIPDRCSHPGVALLERVLGSMFTLTDIPFDAMLVVAQHLSFTDLTRLCFVSRKLRTFALEVNAFLSCRLASTLSMCSPEFVNFACACNRTTIGRDSARTGSSNTGGTAVSPQCTHASCVSSSSASLTGICIR